MKSSEGVWNSLEVAKLAASLLTPIVVAVLGFVLADIQQKANNKSALASRERADAALAAEKRQSQQFQQGLAASNRALSLQLQQADIKSRTELQDTELRWRKLLQDESARRSAEEQRAELRRADEVRNADLRRTDDQRRQEIERERKDSVADFSRAISERRIRSVLLASGLRRRDVSGNPATEQEINARKAQYDEAFAQWNANVQLNMFRIRRVLGTKEYTVFEDVVEQRLGAGLFAATDACLTKAYDTSMAGGRAGPVLDQCRMNDLLQSTLDCGYVMADLLFRLASSDVAFGVVQRQIDSQCPERG